MTKNLWKWYRNVVFNDREEYPNLVSIERAKRAYWFHRKKATLVVENERFKYRPY